jgi:hypothetical protein
MIVVLIFPRTAITEILLRHNAPSVDRVVLTFRGDGRQRDGYDLSFLLLQRVLVSKKLLLQSISRFPDTKIPVAQTSKGLGDEGRFCIYARGSLHNQVATVAF